MNVLRSRWMWVLAVVGVLLLVSLILSTVSSLPPRSFTFIAGRPGGAYYTFAQEYQKIAADYGFADLDGLEFVARIDLGTDTNGEAKNEIRAAVTPDHRDYAQVMGRVAAPTGYAPPANAPQTQGSFPAAVPQPTAGADPRPATGGAL